MRRDPTVTTIVVEPRDRLARFGAEEVEAALAAQGGGLVGVDPAEVADDLAHWRATIPGKVEASAEALSGPMTPPGQRVQTLNPPGSEVGPGAVATWGVAQADRVDAMGFSWSRSGKSSKHIPFDWSGPDAG